MRHQGQVVSCDIEIDEEVREQRRPHDAVAVSFSARMRDDFRRVDRRSAQVFQIQVKKMLTGTELAIFAMMQMTQMVMNTLML